MWGTIPDWVNVLLALISLLGFFYMRDKNDNVENKPYNNKANMVVNDTDKSNILDFNEKSSCFRFELYKRVLIGIILGFAIGPLDEIVLRVYYHGITTFDYWIVSNNLFFINSIILILISLLITIRYHTKMHYRIFVETIERAFVSLVVLLFLNCFIFLKSSSSKEVDLDYDVLMICIISSFLIVLIGFRKTPIDVIVEFIHSKISKIKRNKKNT